MNNFETIFQKRAIIHGNGHTAQTLLTDHNLQYVQTMSEGQAKFGIDRLHHMLLGPRAKQISVELCR